MNNKDMAEDLFTLTTKMRVLNLFCIPALLLLAASTNRVSASPLPTSNCNLLGSDGLCYTDAEKKRFVFIDSSNSQCHMIVDGLLVDEVLIELSIAGTPPYIASSARLSEIISVCKTMTPLREAREQQKRNLIFPGTKWCGPGDDAENFDDLGELKELDMCCRDHDHCPDNIKPSITKHNITNTSAFTISHCDCDEAFRQCLKKVDYDAAGAVGFTYFSTGFVKCFRLALPVEECLEWSGIFSQTCSRYKFDESGDYSWQIFDLAPY